MEYLEDHLDEWLGQELEPYGEEDYLFIDCPGQVTSGWAGSGQKRTREGGREGRQKAFRRLCAHIGRRGLA